MVEKKIDGEAEKSQKQWEQNICKKGGKKS